MEGNNEIFLAGNDALVYLAEPIHKKYSQHLLGAIHLVRMYLMTNFSTTSPCTHLYTIWMTTSIPQLRMHLMDGLFFNQKTNKNIQILCSLK